MKNVDHTAAFGRSLADVLDKRPPFCRFAPSKNLSNLLRLSWGLSTAPEASVLQGLTRYVTGQKLLPELTVFSWHQNAGNPQ